MLKPAVRGLDISWRTDVTSKQERYVVSYTRNDTGAVSTQTTTDRGFSIEGLYPGAGYRVQVGIYPSNIITSTSNPFLCAADFFLQLGSC